MKPLQNTIAVVAGATRGAGRGIAVSLGEAGAVVYCSGRSSRENPGPRNKETVDETAALVDTAGGTGIAVRCDHTQEEEVAALFARVEREHGRVDLVVNDIWGCDHLLQFGKALWEVPPGDARTMLERAVFTHVVTARFGVPLLLQSERGLIVEVTDGDTFGYRGMAVYDLVKMANLRLAWNLHKDLRARKITHVTSLAVTPGFLRSEEMLERFGVTEENWREGAKVSEHFIASETPRFVGRAVAALAADTHIQKKAGRVFSSWQLSHEYGFSDVDGARPDWGAYWKKTFGKPYNVPDYSSWENGPADIMGS